MTAATNSQQKILQEGSFSLKLDKKRLKIKQN